MTQDTFTPLTPEAFREAHPYAAARTDEQVQWYCDLDAMVRRAFELDIPPAAIIQALRQIALDRIAEADPLAAPMMAFGGDIGDDDDE